MLQPKLFRREPTEILAIQYTGENAEAVEDFVGLVYAPERADHDHPAFFVRTDPSRGADFKEANLFVAANNSWLPIAEGEWVAKDQFGFYPIKNAGDRPVNYIDPNKFSPGDQFFG